MLCCATQSGNTILHVFGDFCPDFETEDEGGGEERERATRRPPKPQPMSAMVMGFERGRGAAGEEEGGEELVPWGWGEMMKAG